MLEGKGYVGKNFGFRVRRLFWRVNLLFYFGFFKWGCYIEGLVRE